MIFENKQDAMDRMSLVNNDNMVVRYISTKEAKALADGKAVLITAMDKPVLIVGYKPKEKPKEFDINNLYPDLSTPLTGKMYEKILKEELREKQIRNSLLYDFFNKKTNEHINNINKPSHYNQTGMETIEVIKAVLSNTEYEGFLKGNIIKYRERAKYKGTESEDYEKAENYKNFLDRNKQGLNPR